MARRLFDVPIALSNNVGDALIQDAIERFRLPLQRRCSTPELPYTLLFSCVFIAYDRLKHASIEDILQEADAAMYANKYRSQQSS